MTQKASNPFSADGRSLVPYTTLPCACEQLRPRWVAAILRYFVCLPGMAGGAFPPFFFFEAGIPGGPGQVRKNRTENVSVHTETRYSGLASAGRAVPYHATGLTDATHRRLVSTTASYVQGLYCRTHLSCRAPFLEGPFSLQQALGVLRSTGARSIVAVATGLHSRAGACTGAHTCFLCTGRRHRLLAGQRWRSCIFHQQTAMRQAQAADANRTD